VRRESCRFVANLAVSRDMHTPLISENVHLALRYNLNEKTNYKEEEEEEEESSKTSEEEEGNVAAAKQALVFATLAVANISGGRDKEILSELMNVQIASHLVKLVDSRDYRCRRYAVLALSNFLSDQSNHEKLLDVGCLSRIVKALSATMISKPSIDWENDVYEPIIDQSGQIARSETCNTTSPDDELEEDGKNVRDSECCFNAVYALGVLASNEDVRALIGKSGAIEPTVELCADLDTRMRCLAMHALRKLSTHAGNRITMVFGGVLGKLKDIAAKDFELANQQELSALLCNLARSPENRMPITESGLVTDLVSYINTVPDIEVVSQSTAALANLAEDMLTHQTIVKARAVHFAVCVYFSLTGSFLIHTYRHHTLYLFLSPTFSPLHTTTTTTTTTNNNNRYTQCDRDISLCIVKVHDSLRTS